MRLDPLQTWSPETGAVRPVTDALLHETFLTPVPAALDLAAVLEQTPGPWSESLGVAPDETIAAVERALGRVMRATKDLNPDSIDPSLLSNGRARKHLEALLGLWRELGCALPSIEPVKHILGCDPDYALEPLPIIGGIDCPFGDPLELEFATHLVDLFGEASEQAQRAHKASLTPSEGTAGDAFGAIQRGLGRSAELIGLDESLSLWALRNPQEEAEFVAALSQKWLDEGVVSEARDIGVLAPDGFEYTSALQGAYSRVGLPLAGLPDGDEIRDGSGEVLSLALALIQGRSRQTALASLLVHSSMPWTHELGRKMAREVMDRGHIRSRDELDERGLAILDAIKSGGSSKHLAARLYTLAKLLPDLDLGSRINAISPFLVDPIDWRKLKKAAAPSSMGVERRDRFVEGVSLFSEKALPWRSVRRIIVLGMSGSAWPRLPGSDPFFTEGEIEEIRDSGLLLNGRRQHLERGLALFRRQLSAASDGGAFTVPSRDMRGDRLSPSTALTLLGPMLGSSDPHDFVQMPDTDRVPSAQAKPDADRGCPKLPKTGALSLKANLLQLRPGTDVEFAKQSPSRLENLLVSPLAWLLDELVAKDRTWEPELLDVLTLGTLLHGVLERVFPAGAPIPESEDLSAQAVEALNEAIHEDARFLERTEWATERESLRLEAIASVQGWRRILEANQAEVLANEISLFGAIDGLPIAGKADAVLALPDGRLVVVDHKRAGSGPRRDRLNSGWDLQVALYRKMLETTPLEFSGIASAGSASTIVCAYHTLMDQTLLTDAVDPIVGAETVNADISGNALHFLKERLKQVRRGIIELNHEGDPEAWSKERSVKAYALEDPLQKAFMLPNEEAQR
jgi:ATP-dependent helicase/nuclease subunit B